VNTLHRNNGLLSVDLQSLAYWDCSFEPRLGHGYLSLVTVVCCQAEFYAQGRSIVERRPIACGVSECDRGILKRRHRATTTGKLPEKKACCIVKIILKICLGNVYYCSVKPGNIH
jgi:hypothetical protein